MPKYGPAFGMATNSSSSSFDVIISSSSSPHLQTDSNRFKPIKPSSNRFNSSSLESLSRTAISMAPKAEKKPAEKKPAGGEEKKAEKKPRAEKKLPKDASSSDKKKKRTKKNVETYKIYIFKVLKQVHPLIRWKPLYYLLLCHKKKKKKKKQKKQKKKKKPESEQVEFLTLVSALTNGIRAGMGSNK